METLRIGAGVFCRHRPAMDSRLGCRAADRDTGTATEFARGDSGSHRQQCECAVAERAERIVAAQSAASTSLGALLPNVSGFMSGSNQTVNLAAFGFPPDRLSGLGLQRLVTEPFDVYNARANLVQNIFSLSLIQRCRAANTGVDVAGFEAEVTKRDVMATAGLLYMEASRAETAVNARLADLELSQQLFKLAQDRKQAGVATGLDVTREEVQLENTRQLDRYARDTVKPL